MDNNKYKYNFGRIIFYSSVILLATGAGLGIKLSGSLERSKEENRYEFEKVEAEEYEVDGVKSYRVPDGYTLMIDDDGNYYGVRVESNVKVKKKIIGQ